MTRTLIASDGDDEMDPAKLAARIPRTSAPRRARSATTVVLDDLDDDELDPAALAARIPR